MHPVNLNNLKVMELRLWINGYRLTFFNFQLLGAESFIS